MKKTHTQSGTAKTAHSEHQHEHKHAHTEGQRPHPLTAFFGCCLGDEPAPLSAKIQDLRAQIPGTAIEEIQIQPGENFTISKDMIIGDVLVNFPQTRNLIEDLHPLGLLSPILNQISIEMFFADQSVDTDDICLQLTKIIND